MSQRGYRAKAYAKRHKRLKIGICGYVRRAPVSRNNVLTQTGAATTAILQTIAQRSQYLRAILYKSVILQHPFHFVKKLS